MSLNRPVGRKLIPALLLPLLAFGVLAGCGGGDSSDVGNSTDAAFVADMIPHHEGAVEMARIAQERSDRQQIQTLAAGIISSQEAEIAQLEALRDDLPDPGDSAGHMGMDDSQMGMDHGDMGHMEMGGAMMGMDMNPDELREAERFDLAFILMMIPHHEGAIRMAEELKQKGENPELQAMADEIIEAQQKEIEQMRQWRSQWYGEGQS
jgi:uncharacterized protein (DUF305 family)